MKLQQCKEYIYAERCSRDKVIAAVENPRAEEVWLHEEEEHVSAMEQRAIDTSLVETINVVDKANSRITELKSS